MNPDSCTRKFNPPHNIIRLRFYFRLFIMVAFLMVLAVLPVPLLAFWGVIQLETFLGIPK